MSTCIRSVIVDDHNQFYCPELLARATTSKAPMFLQATTSWITETTCFRKESGNVTTANTCQTPNIKPNTLTVLLLGGGGGGGGQPFIKKKKQKTHSANSIVLLSIVYLTQISMIKVKHVQRGKEQLITGTESKQHWLKWRKREIRSINSKSL